MATSVRPTRSNARRVTSSLVAAAVAALAVLACTVGISAAAARPATVRPAAAVAVANLLKISTLVSHPQVSLFCTKAEASTKGIPDTGSATSNTSALQAAYNNFKAEEPYVLANAPGAIKPDVQTVFTFANKLWTLLAQAHFNFMKLQTSSFESLVTSNQAKVTTASKAIGAYLKKNCPGYKG